MPFQGVGAAKGAPAAYPAPPTSPRSEPPAIHSLRVEADHVGARMFEHACKLGLEGIVCKRRDSAYSSGRSKSWLKVKNPASPAMMRLEDGTW